MVNKNNYKKAYVELYELIKVFPKDEKAKIPKDFIESLKDNMDKNYKFKFDDSKDIFNQNIMIETKALLVGLYQKYLVKPEEMEFWNMYNKKIKSGE